MAPLALIIAVSLLDLAGLVNKALTPSALLAMGFLAGLYALLLSSVAHRRVILHEDSIEVIGWFSARKLKAARFLAAKWGREAFTALFT